MTISLLMQKLENADWYQEPGIDLINGQLPSWYYSGTFDFGGDYSLVFFIGRCADQILSVPIINPDVLTKIQEITIKITLKHTPVVNSFYKKLKDHNNKINLLEGSYNALLSLQECVDLLNFLYANKKLFNMS